MEKGISHFVFVHIPNLKGLNVLFIFAHYELFFLLFLFYDHLNLSIFVVIISLNL